MFYNPIANDDPESAALTPLLPSMTRSTVSKSYFSIETKIIIIKAIFTVSLLECFALLFYQQEHTQKGLMAFPLQMAAPKASGLAWVLALLDLSVAITATNVDNADELFKPNNANKTLMFIVQAFSWATYLINSIPAGIPLFQLLKQEKLLTQQIITPLIGLGFSIPGAVFYALYSAKNLLTTFEAMHTWWEDPGKPFRRMLDPRLFILHYMEALLRFIAVIGSRTATAIFIVRLVIPLLSSPYCRADNNLDEIILGLMVLIGISTVINVSMTRVITNLTKLIDPQFDAVTPEAYREAEKTAHHSVGAKMEMFITHLSSAITASGFGLYAAYGVSNKEWEVSAATMSTAIVVGSLMLAKSLYVKHAATVYTHAIKNQKELAKTLPLLEKDPQELFSQLTKTFESDVVKKLIAVFNFCSCSAKALSFYSFLVGLNAAVEPLGHGFDPQELLALCLILAPESFKNSFILNQRLMKEAITGYLAKYAMVSAEQQYTWMLAKIFYVYFKSPSTFELPLIERILAQRRQITESTHCSAPVPGIGTGSSPQNSNYFSVSRNDSMESAESTSFKSCLSSPAKR